MGIIGKDIQDIAGEAKGGEFITAKEFDVEGGLVVKVGSFKVEVANNYGAEETDYLFKQGILKLGDQMVFTFEVDGVERVLTTKSAPLFFAFNDLNPEAGDLVRISRTGTGTGTRYTVEAVDGGAI